LTFKEDTSALFTLDASGDKVEPKLAWESKSLRNSYNVPVYHRDHIYGYSSRFLTCVDAKTGEQKWRSREPGDGFTILVGDHLVILTKNGGVHAARATPQGYEEAGSVEVFDGDLAWSPPAFSGGSVYARGLAEIARVNFRPASDDVAHKDQVDSVPGKRFAAFLREVEKAADKKAAVDQFMGTVDRFPLVEEPDVVHFLYRGPASDVAVAGDLIGARQERAMTKVAGTDLFYYSTRLEPEARTSYAFFVDYEYTPDPRNPRKVQTAVFNKDMNMSFTGEPLEMSWVGMPRWREPEHLREPSGTRGRIESHELESEALEAQTTVDVYLPPGYDEGDERYPVVYVFGGTAARTHGRLPDSLDNLIGKNIRPVIVVFINDGAFRKPNYAALFGDELIPFIDSKYRTIASREGRMVFGAGFAAFDSLVCLVKYPQLAANVGLQSPFMMDFMLGQIEPLPSADEHPMRFYVDWARYDLRNPHEAWDMGESGKLYAKKLKEHGYVLVGGGEALDGTGWPSWRNRTDAVFQSFFPIKSAGSH
jgi:enterochelin esterase-like enzyme